MEDTKTLAEEINSMLNIPPAAAQQQANGTEDPVEGGQGEQGGADGNGAAGDPGEPGEEDEIKSLKDQIAELKALISNQAAKPKDADPANPPAPQTQDLVSEEEFQNALKDRNAFNVILNRVYDMARQDAIRDVPAVVDATAKRQAQYAQSTEKFYKNNPDLAEYPQAVALVANQVVSEHPEMPLDEVLNETAKRAREILNVSAGAKKKEDERESPAFPEPRGSSSRGGRGADTRSQQQKELDAMLGI